MSSLTVHLGLLITYWVARITSPKLCGGISVDIPTAIPELPLISIFGICDGKNLGSFNVPSKLAIQSAVPFFRSLRSNSEYFVSLDSVYLIAAKDFGSSCVPQLPCPSINGIL